MELEPIFSVSEFNESVNHHLRLMGTVTVEGELSQFRVVGQWIYAAIKDEDASVEVFSGVFKIRNLHSLEVGMLVRVTGVPGMYTKTGRFSLQAESISPSGEGALKIAYEKLKARLTEEGIFDPGRKRPLPQFPERIGLLTAKGSQAYQDFVKVTNERIGGVKIIFYPVTVQGSHAVDSVIGGLKYFNSLTDKPDLLVLTRGGGSLEDLIAFNDERLVREVFASKIPTVCAIGHEGDVSLAELAADLRASTPSNASELIFRSRREVISAIDNSIYRIEQVIRNNILGLELGVRTKLATLERHLDQSFGEIGSTVDRFLYQLGIFYHRLEHMEEAINTHETRLTTGMVSWIKLKSERVTHLEDKLHVLDPHAVIKRGFSIVRDSAGKLVRSLNDIQAGSAISAVVTDGTIDAEVTGTRKGEI